MKKFVVVVKTPALFNRNKFRPVYIHREVFDHAVDAYRYARKARNRKVAPLSVDIFHH